MHAADNGIGDDGARALATSLEKNTTLEKLNLHGARLCARWLGRGAMWRGPTAGSGRARARTMQSDARACAVGRGVRAASVSLPGTWLLLVGA